MLASVRFGCGMSAAVLGGLSPKVAVSLGRLEFGSPVVDADALLAALPAVAPRLVHLSVVGVEGVGVAALAAAVGRLPRLPSLVTPLLVDDAGLAAVGGLERLTLDDASRVTPTGVGALAAAAALRRLVVKELGAATRAADPPRAATE
ncbi:hypothetical protein I4F81_008192 [Pyropia yezoensis]|uniref:Uncharacterized protein n=1 Tax=Pyropia yezoensis TaxID=2788 RepID=A0ACC3C788_PYRYE|nr:hypothetical protein I4F81_008192 [Neopyropia yezoensis]